MLAEALVDSPILSQVALSYSPIIDKHRNVLATRLSVFALRPGRPLKADQLLGAVGEVWTPDGPPVVLAVRSEELLDDLLHVDMPGHVQIEVPKFMAADARLHAHLQALADQGAVLLLSGRPEQPLPAPVLACFRHSIIDVSDERRPGGAAAPAHVQRKLGFFQSGVRTVTEMEGAFRRGAAAVVGWPIDDVVLTQARRGPASRPDLSATIQLINMVEEGESIDKIDRKLRSDPTLAYKLMRYINAPIFGLAVEVDSFAHAIRMLGYQRLKRWLSLLLVTADDAPDLKPVMFAAVRRGLVMERMADASLGESARSELFVCGVFSLLDRMFQEPFEQLLRKIPVPEHVYAALADQRGPLFPFIQLVRALEGGAGVDIRECAEPTLLSMRDVNRALLQGLAGGLQLA
jgi:c-di-GMP phosphodiesterase